MKAAAAKTGRSLDEVAKERAANNPAGRFCDPLEFGEACPFLCGVPAGFITGQNLLLDRGAFPWTLSSPPPAGGADRSPGLSPAIFTDSTWLFLPRLPTHPTTRSFTCH